MNQLDKQYQELLQDIMHNGVHKETRNGKTISRFGKQIRHNMKDGFPLLTTKKMYWKGIVTELLWFLRGDTNIKFLVDNDCHIWDGDAYKSYSDHFIGYEDVPNKELFIEQIKTDDEFAKKWGELGPVYGKQWRKWKGKLVDKSKEFDAHTAWVPEQIDQIANLINDLKTNPDSRRLMVSAWNVGELDQMVLPPCHYGFQVYTRELNIEERYNLIEEDKHSQFVNWQSLGTDRVKEVLDEKNIPTRAISLMWNQRSVDTFLGLPFNIASYGLLLEILAKMTNMIPDELIGNLGDVHLYQDHLSQAREQITREPFRLPKLEINDQYWVIDCDLDTHILSMLIEDFQVKKYQSHPTIKAQLSN
jgi:thymidylate synthase